jgi:radical SAM superfamily enzyme YgiQ (UPF0313 family)
MRVLLVHPEFRIPSFWNFRDTCKLIDARFPAPPLGLCTVAALLPKDWTVRLVDCNIEPWNTSLLDWADIVLTGGMFPQRSSCLEIVRTARQRGKTVVVGGPDPTSSPQFYTEASHLVLGEGEITLPKFLEDFRTGSAMEVYSDLELADITKTAAPRFDLLKFKLYSHMDIQFSRGCPFLCEFCDVPERYGRIPRAKTTPQFLAELQNLYDLGFRGHVNIVDDNFIANKKLAKGLLVGLERWLKERAWPFEFTAEASINLADDEELLERMKNVGFFSVFVGIESPEETTLDRMRKKQNTNRTIAETVHTIYRYGMWVNAGFILGADGERESIADGMIQCIEETAIPVNMAGLLFALPNTHLTRRLRMEGRLPENYEVATEVDGDHCTVGLNFEPSRPRINILRDYLKVIETTYTPQGYFERVRRVAAMLDSSERKYRSTIQNIWLELKGFVRMALKLGVRRETLGPFWRTFFGALFQNPRSIRYVGFLCALYVHLGPFSKYIVARTRTSIAAEEEKIRAFIPTVT